MRATEFAAPPMAKRHETNFTRKDSLPQRALLSDDGSDEIFPPSPGGGSKRRPPAAVFRTKNADAKHRLWREARRDGVTASKGSRAGGSAAHPTPRPFGPRPSPCRGG